MKILLVEDEKMLSGIVAKGLRKLGYAVDTAYDGQEACYLYEVNEYDLMILDLNLPKKDGIDVLKEIREKDQDIKILILSARVKVSERILGLDEGANDYLIKPFDFGELEARVRNLLRRSFQQHPTQLALGDLMMDTSTKKVFWQGDGIELTKKEFSILEYLLAHKNVVVSAETLVEHIWESEFDPFSNVLRYHLHTLKKKLQAQGAEDMIQTVRGYGYIMKENDHEPNC